MPAINASRCMSTSHPIPQSSTICVLSTWEPQQKMLPESNSNCSDSKTLLLKNGSIPSTDHIMAKRSPSCIHPLGSAAKLLHELSTGTECQQLQGLRGFHLFECLKLRETPQ
ncbi:unnamed protein product [Linum tenue]|uniref:Uncharacterized protein n=1 Tax=Linum tenue TaxID=586396 RepID=A0AAV0IQK0_9ROSI|nr:unnamed protein product [Linum tenue]